MIRPLFTAFAACCLLASNTAHAQEVGQAEAAAAASSAPAGLAVVEGLAVDDLLNIRATASPFGNVMGRLPNGAVVRRHECQVVDGYEWCRVDAIEMENVSGWSPARYLHDLEIEGAMADVEAAEPALMSPEREPAPEAAGDAAAAKADRPSSGAAGPLPPGLEARFAGVPSSAPPLIGASETNYLPALRTFLRSLDTGDAVETGTEAGDVPVPTQRPALPGSTDAVGEIPCARHVGQPMTRCHASAVRLGEASADVTVTWPDGGTRVIEFRNGAPAGSNANEEFRFTREGTLNLIRIGVSERFEITDAFPFAD